jgi:6-phosphogluconolactonase
MGTFDLQIFADAESVAKAACDEVIARAQAAIAARGFFAVSLSGGSTPKRLYELLAERSIASGHKAIDWRSVQLFFGDERCVPPDHPDSNYRMVREALIGRVPIAAENVHRIKGETADPHLAASEYQQQLVDFFSLRKRTLSGLPRFDVVLLGMGPDGHTASLFPGTPAVREQTKWVCAPLVPKLSAHRITLSAPVLSNGERITFLVAGADKAETLKRVIQGPFQPDVLPSQLIRPTDGQLTWLIDEAAARLVKE